MNAEVRVLLSLEVLYSKVYLCTFQGEGIQYMYMFGSTLRVSIPLEASPVSLPFPLHARIALEELVHALLQLPQNFALLDARH